MTHVEAKPGLRTCDSKPSDTGSRGHSDPMDVDVINSVAAGKGKGSSRVHEVVVSSAVELILKETITWTQRHAKAETCSETQESPQTYHTGNSYADNPWFDDG